MKDSLGDRMKEYESVEAQRRGMPLVPLMIRLDGRNFSTFTKGLERPYDYRLSQLMIDLTHACCLETGAHVGYTQSDEITLCLHSDAHDSQLYFDGRVQKIASCLAAFASVYFNSELPRRIPEKADRRPVFDCRVWSVPTLTEAANCILWRELDATKNSIAMAAHHYYSHRELLGKNGKMMQEMLFAKGVNWDEYPSFFKRGAYVIRRVERRPFSPSEIEKLPEKHEARKDPSLIVERNAWRSVQLPKLASVTNREDVLFGGSEPVVTAMESASA